MKNNNSNVITNSQLLLTFF